MEAIGRLAGKVLRRSAAEEIFLRSNINLTRPSDFRATLTERCNYRCVYCSHWRQDSYADEMSLAEWQSVLLSIKAFVPNLAMQFIGGEPMLVPWFTRLVQFCADEAIDWGVITNGSSLSAARVKALVAARPLNIDVSIDSRDAAQHDYLRGVAGSMAQVSAGIERLVAERARTRRLFPIRLKPTVTRQTIGSLLGLVDWAATMPSVLVDLSPVRLLDQKDIAALYPDSAEEMAALRRVIAALIARKRDGAPIETSIEKLRAIGMHFERRSNGHGVSQCRVGLRSIDIRPNGDVNHCWKFERIGNLRQSSMAEIWHDAARREVVAQTVACDLFKTTCSTACLAHRTFAQDVARGIKLMRLRET